MGQIKISIIDEHAENTGPMLGITPEREKELSDMVAALNKKYDRRPIALAIAELEVYHINEFTMCLLLLCSMIANNMLMSAAPRLSIIDVNDIPPAIRTKLNEVLNDALKDSNRPDPNQN